MHESHIRIVAPHFVAGAVVHVDKDGTWMVSTAKRIAPIIKYMANWGERSVREYCAKKGWALEEGEK